MQKSYIVNFNAYQNSAVPVFRLYNQELEEKIIYFTYLGMLFDKHMNLHHAASHALRPCNAAIPTSSHVFKVSIFQLRRSPFFTWFVLRFISFS